MTSALEGYLEAPLGYELEFSMQAILDETAALDKEARVNYKQGKASLYSTTTLQHYFLEGLVKPLAIIGDEYHDVTRGRDRPGAEHLHKGAYLGQKIGLELETLLKYIAHDYIEDKAKSIKHLDRMVINNPLTDKLLLPEHVGTAGIILSDNHMFVAKQLRDNTKKVVNGEEKKFYNIKPNQIMKQFSTMLKEVSSNIVKDTIKDVQKTYKRQLKHMNASESLVMINRNSLIYPHYIDNLIRHTDRILIDQKRPWQQRVDLAMGIVSAKYLDGCHNAIDTEAMDSQRRTRREVKTAEILRLGEHYKELLNEALQYLHHSLMEMHLNSLENYHNHLNIPLHQDKDSLEAYVSCVQRAKKEDPRSLGYTDKDMMKRHEETILQKRENAEQKDYKGQLQTYKDSGAPVALLEKRKGFWPS